MGNLVPIIVSDAAEGMHSGRSSSADESEKGICFSLEHRVPSLTVEIIIRIDLPVANSHCGCSGVAIKNSIHQLVALIINSSRHWIAFFVNTSEPDKGFFILGA